VVASLRPGAVGTKRLVALLGDRLVRVRFRDDPGRGRLKTAEVILDAALLDILSRRPSPAVLPPEPEPPPPPPRPAPVEPPPIAPCVCRALLGPIQHPQVTFAFFATAEGQVLVTVDELPNIWATGSTIEDARAAVTVELALLLAANGTAVQPARTHLLLREIVALSRGPR
jgi:predicted RNase H-like HicB family nuclease